MKNFSLEKTLLFLGDKSRYIFAKELTGTLPQNYENFFLRLEHGDKLTEIQQRENFLCVTSFKTPPGIRIISFSNDYDDWTVHVKKFSRILIFEEFPFEKDSTQQLIETWRGLPKDRPLLSIVLMDLLHRQGSTDLDRLDDALAAAQKNYAEQELEVIFFRPNTDAVNILYRHESRIARRKKVLSGELEKIYDRMYELDFLYDDFVMDCEGKGGCLSLNATNGICSFDSVRLHNKDSVWDCYNAAALKRLFPSDSFGKGNLNDLMEIYAYILAGYVGGKSPLSEAEKIRVNKGKFELMRVLQSKFYDYMTARKFSVYVPPHEVRDVIAYKKLTSDSGGRLFGINAEYNRKLRHFVETDAKDILESALKNYIKFFEKVI